jgi:hypothetical protein
VVRVPGYRSRGPGFVPGATKFFWVVVGLERGPLRLVSITEELLGRKSSGSGLETREYDCRDPPRWPRYTRYMQKLTLTWLRNGGRSVGIVRSRTKATGFSFLSLVLTWTFLHFRAIYYFPSVLNTVEGQCYFIRLWSGCEQSNRDEITFRIIRYTTGAMRQSRVQKPEAEMYRMVVKRLCNNKRVEPHKLWLPTKWLTCFGATLDDPRDVSCHYYSEVDFINSPTLLCSEYFMTIQFQRN